MDPSRRSTPTRPVVRRTALLCSAAAVALAVLTGCGSTGDTNGDARASGPLSPDATSSELSDTPSVPVTDYEITISDFEYEVPEKVKPGATVLVKNEDDVAHTVTAEDGPVFDVVVEAHEEASFVAPDTAGQYPFLCTFHSNMHGTLVVG